MWWFGNGDGMSRTMSATRVSEKSGRHTAVSNGAALLSEIVEQKLMENVQKIAQAVLDGALKGTPSNVTLMVKIAEGAGQADEPEVVRNEVSLATTLADAPVWTAAASEETGESTGGSREPEG